MKLLILIQLILLNTFIPYVQTDLIKTTPLPAMIDTFGIINTLDPISLGSIDTQHKPQGKTWKYAGKWWAALPPSSGGTWIMRLDGTTWTPIYKLSTSGARNDCWVDGNLVHVLMFKGNGVNSIATVEYDSATNAYKAWTARPAVTNITFPSGVESATLTVDGVKRMWVAADAVNDVQVWWSDSPYSTWSAPITVATGINSDDISAITKMKGNKIGVFWSNQNTGLFGFKTHLDSDSANLWSADEQPASQSVIPGNLRMADDHMNLVVGSDGTLYCASKTSYNNATLPDEILLVRRPSGTWDSLYTVTLGDGSQSIAVLNEAIGKLKVIYTSESNGGQILYKETSVPNISFGPAKVLMGTTGPNYNFSSSTHQAYNSEVVIVATNQGTPRQIVSVLATDAPPDVTAPTVTSILRSSPTVQNTTATTVVYAVNFSEIVTGVNAPDFTLVKTGTANGIISNVSGSGAAYQVTVNTITGTGSLRLDLNSNGTGIADGSNNSITSGFTTGETYNVSTADTIPPSVTSILRSSPTLQNTTATTVVYAVNFSETVTGVNGPDFTLVKTGTANGNISNVSGSGAAYQVTVNTITGTGSLRLDLNNNGTGIADGANNPITSGFITGETYNVSAADTTPPSVISILRSSPTGQNTSETTVVYAVNFSESVTGVNAPDFTLTKSGTANGTISNVSGSGASYNVTVNTITGTGSLRLDLNNSGTGIADGANNSISGGFTTGETYNVSTADITPPSVTSILRLSPIEQNTRVTTVVYAVNFSETVTGVNAPDFTLTKSGTANGTISTVSGSGAAYNVTVNNITGVGSLRLDLNSSGTGIVDGSNNAITGGFTAGQTYNVSDADITPPSVSGILRSSPTEQNTSASTVTFAVNFSEVINGADTSDFILIKGGTVNGAITTLLGACANYTVTITSITGSGTLGLALKNAGTGIVDAIGNHIAGGFNSGQTYTISEPPGMTRTFGNKSSTSLVNPQNLLIETESIAEVNTGAKKAKLAAIEANVYPNPFSGEATFRFALPNTQTYIIKLYDSRGFQWPFSEKGMATANVPKNIKIDGSRLPAGLYMISIQTDNEVKVLKLTKGRSGID